jgi:hypothetical protein
MVNTLNFVVQVYIFEGQEILIVGPGGALMYSSESKLFTIRQPIVTTTRSQEISSSSSGSSTSGSGTGSASAAAATTSGNLSVSSSSDTGNLSFARTAFS